MVGDGVDAYSIWMRVPMCVCPCVQIQKPKQDIGCLPLLLSMLQSWDRVSYGTRSLPVSDLWCCGLRSVCVGAWDSNSGAHTWKANASLKTMLLNSFMHLCDRSLPRPCPYAPPLILLLSSPLLLSGCPFVCHAYLETLAWDGVGGDLPFQRQLMSVSTLTHWAVSPAATTLRSILDLTLKGRYSLQTEEYETVVPRRGDEGQAGVAGLLSDKTDLKSSLPYIDSHFILIR